MERHGKKMLKVLTVFGTRPEAIKMCPLVLELKKHHEIECTVCLTGQHREMLFQVKEAFGLVEDYNLNIMKEKQSLSDITVAVLEKMEPILLKEMPDIVLVHGDTTTSYATALAAFYQKIPVGHVEAGLRTGDIYSPFPEEMNRLLTDRLSTFFFAPTDENCNNLKKEGIYNNIFKTGNTVIDALKYTVSDNYIFNNNRLNEIDFENEKVVLVTAHRRENHERGIKNICLAIAELAKEFKDISFVYPVHMNPTVRDIVYSELINIDNVILMDPIDVIDMHNLISRCYMVMTDSGGIQEEAPHFGKPVLVLRNKTERPEAVEAGTVKVIGTDKDNIFKESKCLLEDVKLYNTMARAINPYGDGYASERIVKALLNSFEKENVCQE